MQGLGVFGLIAVGASRRRSKRVRLLVLLALLAVPLILMIGCAGGTGIGQQHGTAPGTYTINVTGASGSLQHTLPVSLTVQ